MHNIVTVTFKDSNTATANGVRQWDYGQILRIQGLQLPTAVEVHFALIDSKDSVTRIGTTKDGVTDVVIPDSMIEAGKNIFAYVYLRDYESGQTEYEIKIVVTTRAKPEAFDTPEDKELFAQAIEAVNEAADRAEKAGQAATEAAGQAAEDAQQTAEDRKEVAKMVETVTDISEQVKKVEELSNKAQEAATKTGQDAQQIAEDRVEVGKMLETVRDVSEQVKSVEESVQKAKESEQAAAGHRTAVEEMKNSVEQTASTFPQKVQEGVQAIENAGTAEVQEITQAGTAQKTAVEGAGTQAVENVENVKASATEAVETAKTEAVQAVQAEGTTQTGNVTAEGAKQVKSVQDKGAEVLQSIPEDFTTQMETKLDKQQGIENKGKVLVIGEDGNVVPGEVQSGGGDGIAIINTMSGESPLMIPDSAERVNKGLELGGKTDQVQTTGKNLFDIATCPLEHDGVSFKIPKSSGDVVLMGDFEENTQYTLSVQKITSENANSAVLKFDYTDGTRNEIKIKDLSKKSLTSDSAKNVKQFVLINPFGGVHEVSGLQLEKGTTATPYEPYTGGKPSPSPEYPQEIKSVGKWNDEKQKYEVEISISGRNIFDFSTCEEGKVFEGSGNIISVTNGVLTDFIPCFPNSQYSRSRTGGTVVAFYDCDKNKIGFEIVGNTTFVTPEKCRYFRFSALKTMVDYTKIVECPGQTVMDYEPYREPKFFTLTLNKPLRGIGEMKDELSESGILRRVKSITLNGSEKWYKYENSAFVAMNCYGLKIDDLEVKNYNLTTLCNYLKWAKFPQDVESQSAHGGYIYFTVPKETCLDLESFKEWLAKNTPVLEYRLKEPVLEELSEEDKASIRALKTYYPTTVITADGGELDPDIKVTYTADTKNYIDNKVSAKVASIIRQYRLNTANLLSLMPIETQAAMIENDTNNILENAEEMKHE